MTERVEVRPARRREVRAQVAGVIAEIRRREGEAVRAGEVIAALDMRPHHAHRANVDAKRARARAELDKLEGGNRPQEVERAVQVVERSRRELALARSRAERTQRLYEAQLASLDVFEEALTDAQVRANELSRAQAELDLMRAGYRVEDQAAQQAVLAGIEAELRFVDWEIAHGALASPIDGFVITPRIHEKVGMAVERGDLVGEVGDLDRMRVDVLVPEQELGSVAVGQTITMKISGFPEREFRARVEFVPVQVVYDDRLQVNVARVEGYVDNPQHLLRDHMSGWAEIHCGSRSVLHLAVRRILRWFRVRFVV